MTFKQAIGKRECVGKSSDAFDGKTRPRQVGNHSQVAAARHQLDAQRIRRDPVGRHGSDYSLAVFRFGLPVDRFFQQPERGVVFEIRAANKLWGDVLEPGGPFCVGDEFTCHFGTSKRLG